MELNGPNVLIDDDPELDLVEQTDEVDLIDVTNDLPSSHALDNALRNMQRNRQTLKRPNPDDAPGAEGEESPVARPRVKPEPVLNKRGTQLTSAVHQLSKAKKKRTFLGRMSRAAVSGRPRKTTGTTNYNLNFREKLGRYSMPPPTHQPTTLLL